MDNSHSEFKKLDIPVTGLKALLGLENMFAGSLSPLGRLQTPNGTSNALALLTIWESLDGDWIWSVPGLIDPHRSIALIVGDGVTDLVGQYVFPDAEACGPGFHVDVGTEIVRLTGPLGMGSVRAGFFSRLLLEDVPDIEPIHLNLAADHFWVLTACVDAYRELAMSRRLLRLSGEPAGVDATAIAKAWTNGKVRINPGWTVSLFSLLAPGKTPDDLTERLPDLLPELVKQNYLREVAISEGNLLLYKLADVWNPLLWGQSSAINYGLVSQRLKAPGNVEAFLLGGWRTPRGVWLADLAKLQENQIALSFLGGEAAFEVFNEVLVDNTITPHTDKFTMETPWSRDAVVSHLRALPADGPSTIPPSPQPPKSFCRHCGQQLSPAATFCGKCGEKI